MKLAPRMIQSMEILQLPTLGLIEKIEAELNSNPTLEVADNDESNAGDTGDAGMDEKVEQIIEAEQAEKNLTISGDTKRDEFKRFEEFSEGTDDYVYRTDVPKRSGSDDEPDKKMEAMNNTAARGQSLHEYLSEQWRLVDADEKIKKAGQLIIDYIDEKGYLRVRLQQLHNKDKHEFGVEHLEAAIKLVQGLEPTGVGARDIKECLLLQMAQSSDDMSFEKELVSKYLDKLLENKLPEIARKMNCSVERIGQAIAQMRKLDTSPGLQIGVRQNHPIKADVIVEPDDAGEFKVYLADRSIPALRINQYYASMAKDKSFDSKARDFLKNNIRSAQWLMDAIEQRKHTLLRVSQAVVERQKDFFEKGTMFLRPLPMSEVADAVGVHIATVSRAAAGKYIQSPQGIMPLRDLFGGGMDTDDGGSESFEAIRAKMQQIIDNEDKSKPLNDDEIKLKLEELGVKNIARRTVAKYRKIMNIPTTRFRKRF